MAMPAATTLMPEDLFPRVFNPSPTLVFRGI